MTETFIGQGQTCPEGPPWGVSADKWNDIPLAASFTALFGAPPAIGQDGAHLAEGLWLFVSIREDAPNFLRPVLDEARRLGTPGVAEWSALSELAE